MRSVKAWIGAVTIALAALGGTLAAQDEESPGADEGDEAGEPGDVADADAAEPEPSAIDSFYDGLTVDNVQAKVDGFYADQVVYEDPLGRVTGKGELVSHLKKLLTGVKKLSVDVKEEFVSADETVAVWTMTLAHDALAGGAEITVDGVTHVRVVNGRIVGQKNYFDLGEMVYEHTPIVGSIVRWVKQKVLD